MSGKNDTTASLASIPIRLRINPRHVVRPTFPQNLHYKSSPPQAPSFLNNTPTTTYQQETYPINKLNLQTNLAIMAYNPYYPNIPFTSINRPNSLARYGQGPERMYSHGMGGSDRFYGRYFQDDGRDDGYSHDMRQDPRGRVAPYNRHEASWFGRRRRRSER